jgi:RNA polymerase sigma-70 factor (ECF subfamily)
MSSRSTPWLGWSATAAWALPSAWRDLRALRDPDRFEPWLHRILIRECYAEARRRRRWSADLHILPTEVPVDAGGYQAVNDRDELDRAFRRLTVEQRAVVVLFHYLDLPMAEVAERVGVPIGTVKSRLYHATRAMRASMEADGRAPIPRERPA